jgi:hypothetical protein
MAGRTTLYELGMKSKNAEQDAFVFHFMDILTAPIMTYDQSWASAIPDRLKKEITMHRLIAGIKQEEMATMAEVVAYLITATLSFPLDNDWVDIYTHAACIVAEECWQENHRDIIQAPRKLSRNQEEDLIRLRRWIYERRQGNVKKKMKGAEQSQHSRIKRFDFNERAA